MQFEWIVALFIVVAVISMVVGLVLLLRRNWFWIWVKSSCGFLLLVGSVLLGLCGVNFYTFKPIPSDKVIATVSFDKKGEQNYQVVITDPNILRPLKYELHGDLWSLSARLVDWHQLNLPTAYRLDTVEGRFLTLEQERTMLPTHYELAKKDIGFDFWNSLKLGWLPFAKANYSSSQFMPMAAGAIFTISNTPEGLMASPMNPPAEAAVNQLLK